MTRTICAAVFSCAAATSLSPTVSAQPGIAQNGVVNMASRIPTSLPGGAIARGAFFTLQGVKFVPGAATTCVIKNGKITTPVKLTGVTKTRIEAVMPAGAPLGRSLLIVAVDGKSSRPFEIDVVASNPGIFSRNGVGWGPGRIENIDRSKMRVENSDRHPAEQGSEIAIAATGTGNLTAADVLIGGKSARGRVLKPHSAAPNPGEVEIVVKIPKDAAAGCFVPVALLAGPGRASNFVTMAIGSKDRACDAGPLPQESDEQIGLAIFSRTRMRAVREGAAEYIRDDAKVSFANVTRQPPRSPLRLVPPPGTCSAYTGSYQTDSNQKSVFSDVPSAWWEAQFEGAGLDAGRQLLLRRGNQSRPIDLIIPGSYRNNLGAKGYDVHRRYRSLFLDPGELQFSGPGGKQVGPFTLSVTVPPEFVWTDREQIKVVDRSHGLTVHWKAGGTGQPMFLIAGNVDQITTAFGICVCSPKASAGEFTVTPEMLANIPATQDVAGVPYDELVLGSITVSPERKVRGLTRAITVAFLTAGRFVEYR